MSLSGTLEGLLENAIEFVPRLIAALVTFVASLLLSGLVARWVRRAAGKRIADPEPFLLLSRLARWGVIITGALVSLNLVHFDVTGFVAGLGIAGLTVGIAGFLLILLVVQHEFTYDRYHEHTERIHLVVTRSTIDCRTGASPVSSGTP